MISEDCGRESMPINFPILIQLFFSLYPIFIKQSTNMMLVCFMVVVSQLTYSFIGCLPSTVTEISLNSVLSFWSPFIMAKQASEQLMGWF